MPARDSAPLAWRTRHDTFTDALLLAAYTAQDIFVLLPPGLALAHGWDDVEAPGEGLWIQARWSREQHEPVIDEESPQAARRLRTVHVLQIVGVELHAVVEQMLEAQAEQARLLTCPVPGQLMSDRRASWTAAFLMTIEEEAREAFRRTPSWLAAPDEDVVIDPPQDFDEFLRRVPDPRSRDAICLQVEPRRCTDREVRLRELLAWVGRACLHKLHKRWPALMTSDLPPAPLRRIEELEVAPAPSAAVA